MLSPEGFGSTSQNIHAVKDIHSDSKPKDYCVNNL